MSFNLGTAIGYLDLDTSKFKSGFKSALGDLETFSKSSTGASGKLVALGSACSSVGSTLTKKVTLPLVGVGAAAVGVTSKFDSSMSQVAAVSGATGESLDALREKAKEMGATTKFSASDAADAMNYMAMAGWKTEDMLDGISGIMDLAAASGEDLATTSDIVTDALTAFGLTAADSGHFADVLAAASSNANTNVSMMGETFKYCAPIAGSLGYSVEDTAEAIGLMANAGIKSTQAGTALRTIMTSLTGEIQICGESLGEVTIATSNADGSMREFSDILADCRVAFEGLSESEQAAAAESLVGKNAMSGFLAIMNAAPADIKKLSSAIDTCDGTSKRMAETMQDNLGGQLTILKSTLEGLAISIGELLMPLIRTVVSWLQTLLTKLNNLSEEQKKTIVTIAGVVAALGPMLSIVGKLLTALGTLPQTLKAAKAGFLVIKAAIAAAGASVGWIIALIAALVAAFVTLWKTNEEFRNKITAIWNGLVSTFKGFFDHLTESINSLGFNFSNFGEVLKALWMGLCNLLAPYITGVFEYIANYITTILNVILGVVDFFIAVFKGDWEGAWDAIKSIFKAVWDGIVNWFKIIGNVLIGTLDVILGWFGTSWENVWTSIKDFFVGIWNAIAGFFSGICQSIWKKVKPLLDNIVGAFKMAWDVIKLAWSYVQPYFAGIWEGIKAVFSVVAEWFRGIFTIAWEAIKAVWNSVVAFFTMVWAGIKAVFAVVKGVLCGNFTEAWEAIKNLWDTVVNYFSTVWNGVKNVFGAVGSFFSNTFSAAWEAIKKIFNNFGTFFKGLWNTIKDAFSAIGTKIGNAISNSVKAGINGVLGMIEGIVNTFVGMINGAINVINAIPGVSIKHLSKIHIPRLAKGAVLPPNHPFLAVVGDQTSGTNVEAPLSTIQEAVAEVLKSFAPALIAGQSAVVRVLVDLSYLVHKLLLVNESILEMQAVKASSQEVDFGAQYRTQSSIDYARLSRSLEESLKKAPIQVIVKAEMSDGDVYLDKERVGRSIAPVVSRLIGETL